MGCRVRIFHQLAQQSRVMHESVPQLGVLALQEMKMVEWGPLDKISPVIFTVTGISGGEAGVMGHHAGDGPVPAPF